MNISIHSSTVHALVAVSALGAAFAGGAISGRSADATPRQPTSVSAVERAPAPQIVYYVVDSRQAAVDAERAEVITAQERMLAGIIAPERVVHVIDDSPEGRMTAQEAVLVATGGR